MELTNAGPYLISGLVALITAWLTHKRSSKAHKDSLAFTKQELINDTYQRIMEQLREELSRKNKSHAKEREDWGRKENLLRVEIDTLRSQISSLQREVSELREG